ncbi:hypothetical protein E1B28_011699 [Marasmius oreades]|uniref:Uncharacterized protein n=1 Tax=Marasmius oreades TaxID=181124 RepID=A0A9P7RV97_9AGAR|nr:uncharacterized protein E1B28_011699 [Marasmius oreades]KAG7090082.1 hypothetical protein E1B28_011699 [Marasmius oreades]
MPHGTVLESRFGHGGPTHQVHPNPLLESPPHSPSLSSMISVNLFLIFTSSAPPTPSTASRLRESSIECLGRGTEIDKTVRTIFRAHNHDPQHLLIRNAQEVPHSPLDFPSNSGSVLEPIPLLIPSSPLASLSYSLRIFGELSDPGSNNLQIKSHPFSNQPSSPFLSLPLRFVL